MDCKPASATEFELVRVSTADGSRRSMHFGSVPAAGPSATGASTKTTTSA